MEDKPDEKAAHLCFKVVFTVLWVAVIAVIAMMLAACGETPENKRLREPTEFVHGQAVTKVYVTTYGPNLVEHRLPDGTRCISAGSVGFACQWPEVQR